MLPSAASMGVDMSIGSVLGTRSTQENVFSRDGRSTKVFIVDQLSSLLLNERISALPFSNSSETFPFQYRHFSAQSRHRPSYFAKSPASSADVLVSSIDSDVVSAATISFLTLPAR